VLSGQTPPPQTSELVFSYVFPNGNAIPIAPGGTLVFPATQVGQTSSATFIITNRGTTVATIRSITTTNAAFSPTGLPLPPIVIDAGREFRFSVAFSPTQRDRSDGTLRLELQDRTASFALQGLGAAPVFTYEMATGSSTVAFTPNQTLSIADTRVGESTRITIRVKNSGNAAGNIASITLLGSQYQLTDLPFLPVTLPVDASFTFGVTFAPTQPGRAVSRLRIGTDTFDLTSTGLGPLLTFSFTLGTLTTAVQNNGTVFFSPVQVGSNTTARFLVRNTGTSEAAINNILITPLGAFSLANLPALPLSIPPDSFVSFDIMFVPVTLAQATATLRIDGSSFSVTGTGTSPPPISQIIIDGPEGNLQALEQPSYGLSLAQPYSLDLSGTLTLTFNSEVFTNDATVQFASGGRTVPFTIPANTTSAVFPNNASQIRLQTGSTAGTIVIVPSISTAAGGISLTPANPPVKTLVIGKSAPQIVSAQVANKSPNAVSLLLTGFATGRAISQIEIRITPFAGENISNTAITINASSAFNSWYQGAQSQQFGSLFTATIPMTFEGRTTSVPALVDAIQSMSLVLVNSEGSSAPVTVNLR
jgi:hypothetical protein